MSAAGEPAEERQDERSGRSAVPAAVRAGLAPNLRAGLDPRVGQKAQQAFALASARVTARPACAAMFDALGGDGLAALRRSLYYPPAEPFRALCATRAEAVTGVGSPVTILCPSFAWLPLERAAMVLIHEALHQVGLPEAPVEGAMTSAEINRMVWTRCFGAGPAEPRRPALAGLDGSRPAEPRIPPGH